MITVVVRLRTDSVHGSINVGVAIRSETSGASPNDERTNNGSSELRKHVQETSDRRHFTEPHESEGDGGVDVTTRDMTNAIGEDSDAKAKGDGDRELRMWISMINRKEIEKLL